MTTLINNAKAPNLSYNHSSSPAFFQMGIAKNNFIFMIVNPDQKLKKKHESRSREISHGTEDTLISCTTRLENYWIARTSDLLLDFPGIFCWQWQHIALWRSCLRWKLMVLVLMLSILAQNSNDWAVGSHIWNPSFFIHFLKQLQGPKGVILFAVTMDHCIVYHVPRFQVT